MSGQSGLARAALASLVVLPFIAGFAPGTWAQAPAPDLQQQPTGGQTDPKPPAEGAPPVIALPPITTTATRGRKSLVDTPASVSVIERPELDRRMITTIEEMVRYQPGINVNRQTSGTDPFKSLGGFTVRGVGGNRVLTMVDGNRVIERITDQTRDFVDLSNMKRVEVVRGPASVLWGSDALGGVVAFTTKDPADYLTVPGRNVGFQIDSTFSSVNNAFTETVTGAFRHERIEGLLSYTRRDAHEVELRKARSPNGVWRCTRAPESLPCDRLDPADISSDNLLAKLVFNIDATNRLKITGEYFGRLTHVDQLWDRGRPVNTNGTFATTQTLDYKRNQDLERYRVTLEQDWRIGLSFLDSIRWQATIQPQRLDRTGTRLQQMANGQRTVRDDFLGYSEDFYEGEAQLKSSFQLGGSFHQLTYGFYGGLTATYYKRRDVTTNLTTGVVTNVIAGGFNFANARTWRVDGYIQDEIYLFDKSLVITPGVRLATYRILPKPGPGYQAVPGAEPHEIYKSDLAFKLAAVYHVDKTYSLYAQYGEGFKMPTAEQLYTSVPNAGGAGVDLVPNPSLKPESVKSYEIGVRGQYAKAFFSVNVFYARYKEFIQSFVFLANGDITFQNLSRVTLWGVEGTGAWQFHPNWEISGAFSWQRGNQKETPSSPTRPFNGADPFKLVAGLRWIKPEWNLDVDFVGTYQSAMTRTNDITGGYQSKAYAVFDVTAAWEVTPGVTLRAAVFNLFDQRYFLPSTAVTHARTPSTAAVAATNPIELQTQPGRHIRLGLTAKF